VALGLHSDRTIGGFSFFFPKIDIMRGLALGATLNGLLKSLKHSKAEVRWSAAIALESFVAEAEATIPILTQALSDVDVKIQVAATRTLGRIGAPAIPGLLQALDKPEKQVRREAVWALARIGSAARGTVSALTRALQDSDLKVRLGAAQALGAIGPNAGAAVSALVECLHDSNLIFCRLAAQALVRIGPAALDALQQASQSSDRFVRREALWALGHLGQPTSDYATGDTSVDPSSATPARIVAGLNKDANLKDTAQMPFNPKSMRETARVNLT
jgi:HEAT repeat protein